MIGLSLIVGVGLLLLYVVLHKLIVKAPHTAHLHEYEFVDGGDEDIEGETAQFALSPSMNYNTT